MQNNKTSFTCYRNIILLVIAPPIRSYLIAVILLQAQTDRPQCDSLLDAEPYLYCLLMQAAKVFRLYLYRPGKPAEGVLITSSPHTVAINDSELPLFYQSWWLDLVCGSTDWKVITYSDDSGNVYGYWPISESQRFGLKCYQSPELTPFNGPLLFYPDNLQKRERRYSHEHKVLSAMLADLPLRSLQRFRCMPALQNWYPFYNNGFRQTTQYTYQLQHIQDPANRRRGYKSQVRNHIKRAAETHRLVSTKQAKELLPLIDATHHRKGKHTPAVTQDVIDACLSRSVGECWLVEETSTHQNVAGGMIVWDIKRAYLLLLGVDKTLPNRGVVQYLIDHLITRAAQHVDIFDFEGSMIPEVEPVFRAFGGERVPYFVISKASWWFDIAFMALRNKEW